MSNLQGVSPDVARMMGEEPFVSSRRETMRDKRKQIRLTRLAKQYVIDFDLTQACARADLDWDDAKDALREPFFVSLVQELLEQIEPDLIVSRQEVLQGLKREALHADKAATRVSAWNSLAKLMGMELPDPSKKDGSNTPPTINITLTAAPTK
jgi:hypothetical protein